MKTTLTTILLLASLGVMVGCKTRKSEINFISISDTTKFSPLHRSTDSLFYNSGSLTGFTTWQPRWYVFNGGINGKELLKIDIPKLPIDSLIIHVKKSQLRWVNDSTAIIRKP